MKHIKYLSKSMVGKRKQVKLFLYQFSTNANIVTNITFVWENCCILITCQEILVRTFEISIGRTK